ncbi:tRNA (adenosine(37)-N6)-dimethylallyltransferase MiaA [Rubrolithibacter danxiaensis]|uniref:tRNA (adenosine(37)-N6)-dimethylallyltransferase MiaA n=1 Tax=Rubrolithibacter danxiaensis TaxID=3390805 RepID=UPI003BF8D696
MKKYLITIVGPTAIGKTTLAIQLARHFGTEIISADSRQFYRELTIGTAKPSSEELLQVKHHFINSHSINEEFNVGSFEQKGLVLLEQIFGKANIAVLVGGSGLYINAITEGFDSFPMVDPHIREKLNTNFQTEGIQTLQSLLKELDPVYYQQVDINNPQRIIRALEVCIGTGDTYSSLRKSLRKQRPFHILKIGLNTNRELLYKRINARVNQMIHEGLLEEVKGLHAYKTFNSLQTVGYSEIFDFLDNKLTFEQAIEKIKQNTRRYAKRQLTWFRKDPEIQWFEPTDTKNIIEYVNQQIQKG